MQKFQKFAEQKLKLKATESSLLNVYSNVSLQPQEQIHIVRLLNSKANCSRSLGDYCYYY